MVLSDREAADIRAQQAVTKAHSTMTRHIQSNGGNMALAFRLGLQKAVPELLTQVVELFAQLDGASDLTIEDALVTEIVRIVTSFIRSSLASQRGNHTPAAQREAARQIGSVEMGTRTTFRLALHDRAKKLKPPLTSAPGVVTPATPAVAVPMDAWAHQYERLLELTQPLVRLVEWSQRYITLLGNDAGVTSRIARSSHLGHFRTAAADLKAMWTRYEPAIFDARVKTAFAAERVSALAESLDGLTDAERDSWDATVHEMNEQAHALDHVIRAAIGDYQRGSHRQGVENPEHTFMAAAIDEARKSKTEPNKTPLYVGAVLVKDGVIIARGHRGEHKLGEHAEYTLLEKNLPTPGAAANATLYCTLEPCIVRNPPKSPCADWVKRHQITRVVIGVIDPNRKIRGGGVKSLRQAGVDVALFPDKFANEIEALNNAFEREHEDAPIDASPRPRGFHVPSTVPDIFYEWRRWENPTGVLDEVPGVFDKTWVETDEAGEHVLWDICVLSSPEIEGLFERISSRTTRIGALKSEHKAQRYYIVAAMTGDEPGDAERASKSLMTQMRSWPSKLGVAILVGWIAKHHFVGEVVNHDM